MMGFTIIDRYIIRKAIKNFLFVVILLMSIIVIIDITEKVDRFNKHHLDLLTILGFYVNYIPWMAGQLVPITAFIGILTVTAQLSQRTEIIAMLSSGMSYTRFLVPYFIVASFIAGLMFFLNGWVIPRSNRKKIDFELRYIDNKKGFDAQNFHIQIEPNVYFYVQNYNNSINTGYQVTLERFSRDGKLLEKFDADLLSWDSVKGKWHATNWQIRKIDTLYTLRGNLANIESDIFVQKGASQDTMLSLSPKDFLIEDRGFDAMTNDQLEEHIKTLRFRGSSEAPRFEVQKYIRYANPFTLYILAFIGIIVSSHKSRSGIGPRIVLGFSLSFVLLFLFFMSSTLASNGAMSPIVAAWFPNIVFIIVSIFLYRFVPR